MNESSIIELSQKLLRIPSASAEDRRQHQGNLGVIKALLKVFSDQLQVKVFKATGRPRDATLVIWPQKRDFPTRGGLALHTHLDTVQSGDPQEWTRGGPFEGKIDKGQIIGLGAADVKCDAVAKITALLAFSNQRKSNLTPFFVGSFSEEVGMYGMRWIAEQKIIRPQFALVGEPSDGHLAYANKGFALIEGKIKFKPQSGLATALKTFSGKAGHSSAPQKSKNAIELALRYLNKTPQIFSEIHGSLAPNIIPGKIDLVTHAQNQVPREAVQELIQLFKEHQTWKIWLQKQNPQPLFDPSYATSSWTILTIKKNAICFAFDFRVLPGQDAEKLAQKFSWYQKGKVRLLNESLGFFQNPRGKFGSLLKPLLPARKKFITKSGANEAPYYQALGAEAFVGAAGISYGNIHRPNEHLATRSLLAAAEFYQRVVRSLCS